MPTFIPNMPDADSVKAEIEQLARAERAKLGTTMGAALAEAAGVTDSVAAPIYLGKNHEFIPVKYILHYAEVRCLNCNCVSHESKFYAMNFIRSRITGQHVKHLVPCDRPQFNIPVERVPLRSHTTPFCAECDVISLAHLPLPPEEAQITTLEEPRLKGAKPRPAAEAKPPKPSTKATLDDLA